MVWGFHHEWRECGGGGCSRSHDRRLSGRCIRFQHQRCHSKFLVGKIEFGTHTSVGELAQDIVGSYTFELLQWARWGIHYHMAAEKAGLQPKALSRR